MDRKTFNEVGRSGLNQYAGLIHEEYLPELQGRRAIQVYSEMANDATVAAILYAIKMLCRQVDWRVQTCADSEQDIRCAEFVESCLYDQQSTWTDFISECLSFLTYGFSLFEIVYKRRLGKNKNPQCDSLYDDGLIGWQKLAPRSQDTVWQWLFDEHDNVYGIIQSAPPTYEQIQIPAEKLLLFRTESIKNNPEGRSILRGSYRAWYFLKRLQELEGIGVERDLCGLPVLTAPEGVDIWAPQNQNLLSMCNVFVQNIRRDAAEGLTLPAGWELKLLSAQGTRSFDTNEIISRYQQDIARSVLADFIFLGSSNVGSWALSSDKTALFSMAIAAYLDIICEVFNRRAIPSLIELNSKSFGKISGLPKLAHGDIETQNLSELGNFLKEMAAIGLITPDANLEEYLRSQASLPPRLE